MIITDIKQVQGLSVGKTAVLVLQFKVVKADEDVENPCEFCVFEGSVCSTCCPQDRPDGKNIKYIKI